MPAPPPEPDVAIVKHRGTMVLLPSPVRTGSGSTGVISAPRGAPRCPKVSRRSAAEPSELAHDHVPAHRRLRPDDTVEDDRVGLHDRDPLTVRRPGRPRAFERPRGLAAE